MTKQFRERTQYSSQNFADNDRRFHRPAFSNRGGFSPPRTPHSSYYHSREYRRHGDDARLQARANAMSPEHFVAFYTRQQQLKQYLDHERRLRRQQLYSGNVKYRDRQHNRTKRLVSKTDHAENDSDSDSGASVSEHLPNVQTRVHDPPLPQPRPYVQSEPAGGRRRFLTEDERSRISSGYGASASDADLSLASQRRIDDLASLPSMTSSQQPFTPRQVAEVMRAAGVNKGRSPYQEDFRRYDESRSMASSTHKQRKVDRGTSDGGNTFARMSLKAKQALQQAHIAYTSSLNDMMPMAKGFPGTETREYNPRTLSLQNYPMDNSQPPVRYLHGNTRGKIPETFTRQQNRTRDQTTSGNRIGSAHVPYSSPGLSARLPFTARRSSRSQRSSHSGGLPKALNQAVRNSGEPYRRLTSGNKSPYLKSQLPDELTRNLQQSSISEHDSLKYRPFFNHDSSNYSKRKARNSNPDALRSGPPQLRRNHFSYVGPEGADYAKQVPTKIMA